MDLSSLVAGETVYGSAPAPADPMRVAFGVDAHWIQPLGVAMTSILEHNGGVEFHVFSDATPDLADSGRLACAMDRRGSRCVWHLIDPAPLRRANTTEHYGVAIYFRLIAADCLRALAPRFLYLDVDTICLGDLRAMYGTPLGGATLAATMAPDESPRWLAWCRSVGIDPRRYFSSCLMLIDTESYHRQSISERALRLLTVDFAYDRMRDRYYRFLDQPALNVLCQDRFVALPPRCQVPGNDADDYPPDTLVVHYGGPKPWYRWYEGKPGNLFRQCQARSEWADVPIVTEPRTPSEARRTARALWRHGHRADAARWHLRYLRWKLFGVRP